MAVNKTIKIGADTKGLTKSLKDVTKEMNKLNKEADAYSDILGKQSKEYKQIEGQLDTLTNEYVEMASSIELTATSMSELREASEFLTNLTEETQIGTEEYDKYAAALIKVNTQLKNQELALEALDFEQVSSEIGSVVGGITDMAGAFQVLNVAGKGTMEEIIQAFAKFQAISMLVRGGIEAYQSLMKVSNFLRAQAAAATAAQTATTTALTGATWLQVAAQTALNAVLSVNPIFLLIGAVAALVAAYKLFSDSTKDAEKAQESFNASLERTAALYGRFNKALELGSVGYKSTYNALLDLVQLRKEDAQATGASFDELEKFNDKLDKYKNIISDDEIKTSIIEQKGAVDLFLQSAETLTKGLDKVRDDNTLDIFSFLDMGDLSWFDFEGLENGMLTVKNTGIELVSEMQSISKQIKSGDLTPEQATDAAEKLRNLGREYIELSGEVSKTKSRLDELNIIVKEQGSDSDIKRVEIFTERYNKMTEALDGTVESTTKLAEQALDNSWERNLQEQEKKSRELNESLRVRAELLEEINNILERNKSAQEEITDIAIDGINDVLEREQALIDLEEERFNNNLVEQATQREIDALEKKFSELKISEQTFMKERERILANGINNLTELEKELVKRRKEVAEQAKKDLEQERILSEELIQAKILEIQTESLSAKKAVLDAEMAQELNNTELTENEILLIKLEYQKRYNDLVLSEAKARIDKDLQTELDGIKAIEIERTWSFKKIKQQHQERQVLIDQEYDARKKAIKDYYDKEIELAGDNKEKVEQLEKEKTAAIKKLEDERTEKTKENTDSLMNMIKDNIVEIAQVVFDSFSQLASSIQEILNNIAENERAEREAAYEADAQALQSNLDNKLISQENYETELKELEKKREKAERKAQMDQFKRDKAFAITQAVISTAQSVVMPLATLPPPASYIMSGINAAMGAVQIGVISSQRPNFAVGGLVQGMGGTTGDMVTANLSPGEVVINASAASQNLDLLNAINTSTGGASISSNQLSTSLPRVNPTNAFNYNANQPQGNNRVYVVATDINETQDQMARIDQNSTLD